MIIVTGVDRIYPILALKLNPQITQMTQICSLLVDELQANQICGICVICGFLFLNHRAFCACPFVWLNEISNSDFIVMTDFLSSLNEQQRVAVEHTEGPLLILAGAGSGKTRVIAHRIAYLIAEKGVAPWNILAVTFTNKAAQEMRQRVQRLLRYQELSSAPLVSTFHSLCVRILRQDIEKLNDKYSRTFTIYDQDDSLRLIKNCIKDLGYDEKYLGLRATQSAISAAKNRGEDVDAFAARADYVDERRAAMARVYKVYEERLHTNNALDFDDLLIKTVRLLRDVPEVREKFNNKFRYIMVDEYQDTNSLQFALISLLTEKQQNIAVVGDEDQSIYKWRGADITNILNFEKHFPNTKTIRLEQNYRSTQTILDVAGAVVKHNLERKGKTLWTSNPRGERVRYFQAFNAEAEARFVAGKILEHRNEEYDLRAAVLYRTNSQSRNFEEAMRRAGLPYNIVGGFSFYERMEVRDIIAYLKLALNPNDSIALQRVINSPPRGIGKQTLDELARRANDYALTLWETIAQIIEKPEGLSMRAVSALRSFRRIIVRLAELAGTNTEGAQAIARNAGVSPATPRHSLGESDERAVTERQSLSAHQAAKPQNERGSSPTVQDGSNDGFNPNVSSPVAGHRSSVAFCSDIVKAAILDTGYENALKGEKTDEAEARLENLQELVNAAVDYDEQGIEGLREFIDHSALVSDTDQYKGDAPVTLMTAHSAKGLEFPLVFIVGLEDGLFPHSRSATDPAELEEERRLCYVAMTRAERFLYVTHAMKRRVYGEELASEPSQFLNEMPLDLMEDLSRGKSWLSFARGSSAIDYEHGEYRKERKKFEGKTYDSVDSIAEFFKQRATQLGNTGGSFQSTRERAEQDKAERNRRSNPLVKTGSGPGQDREPGWGGGSDRVDSGGSPSPRKGSSQVPSPKSKVESPTSNIQHLTSDFVPGSYVKHAKYGRGLVLRREGVGESLKLTVTFPGYGQKKLIQKYAGLEKA
ncbi:MAG TPA: ATP-dependent DNA helicase Rep [Blastocatellia bacterium]|nr:ATP-dependent DNA helicase Rep [Blastocatellia bacterium]